MRTDPFTLHYVAGQLNIETGKLDMALQRMTRRIAEAAQGTGEAKAALQELGVDARALAAMRPEAAFARISDAMSEVPSQADRVRLAFKLFDSEGVDLVRMLDLGSEGLARMREEAEAFGVVVEGEAAGAAVIK